LNKLNQNDFSLDASGNSAMNLLGVLASEKMVIDSYQDISVQTITHKEYTLGGGN